MIPNPLPGRPLFVSYDDGRIYISAHDHFHQEKLREFKRLIRNAHPDRVPQIWAAGRTRKLLKARGRFLLKEVTWYAQFGLEPPTKTPSRRVESESPSLLATGLFYC